MSKIFLLGTDGFPYGMAAVQKQFLMAKSLKEINNEVTVLSKKVLIKIAIYLLKAHLRV